MLRTRLLNPDRNDFSRLEIDLVGEPGIVPAVGVAEGLIGDDFEGAGFFFRVGDEAAVTENDGGEVIEGVVEGRHCYYQGIYLRDLLDRKGGEREVNGS